MTSARTLRALAALCAVQAALTISGCADAYPAPEDEPGAPRPRWHVPLPRPDATPAPMIDGGVPNAAPDAGAPHDVAPERCIYGVSFVDPIQDGQPGPTMAERMTRGSMEIEPAAGGSLHLTEWGLAVEQLNLTGLTWVEFGERMTLTFPPDTRRVDLVLAQLDGNDDNIHGQAEIEYASTAMVASGVLTSMAIGQSGPPPDWGTYAGLLARVTITPAEDMQDIALVRIVAPQGHRDGNRLLAVFHDSPRFDTHCPMGW